MLSYGQLAFLFTYSTSQNVICRSWAGQHGFLILSTWKGIGIKMKAYWRYDTLKSLIRMPSMLGHIVD